MALTRARKPSSSRLRGIVALAAAATLGLAACGGDDDAFNSGSEGEASSGGGTKSLTVGGSNFTEALILEQLYGQLLTKAGYTVDYKPVVNREIYGKSL